MYTVEIELNMMLATKHNSIIGKVDVRIQMMKLEGGSARWGCLGKHDPKMPTGGEFYRDGNDVVLKGTHGEDFARLINFPNAPSKSSGGIKLCEKARAYPGTRIQGRDIGIWQFLCDKTPPTTGTWRHLCHNLSQIASATEWYIDTCSGFSFSAGTGGYGGEYTSGTLVFLNELRPKDPPIRLHYTASGGGYMTPGTGGTISTENMYSKGSYVVRGTLPTETPFHPRQLTGRCVIVEGSASGTLPIPYPAGKGIKVPTGGGGALSMFLFGTLSGAGSILFTSYRAGAVVAGLAGAISWKAGGSAAATISTGIMAMK